MAQTEEQRMLAYLKSQEPTPPNKKERDRMKAAIAFDLDHMRIYMGQTVEERMEIFRRNGYLYDE